MLKLGDRAKDTITGFQGIVTGITEWLNGCRRIGIQPENLKDDGAPIESQWFDEQQVKVVKAGVFAKEAPTPAPAPRSTGGPRRDPSQRRDPAR